MKIKCEYVCLNQEEDFGTADALRLVSERIHSDVLLISCDTITNIDFFPALNLFRKNNASCVAVFNKTGFEEPIDVPGPKSKHKNERDLVGIDSENNRLLFLASTTDFQENFSLPAHLLRSYGQVNIFSNLSDAHIYLLKRWVVGYLAKSEKFSTIKGELLPFIIKKQMSRPPNASGTFGFSETNFDTNDIFDHIKQNGLDEKVLETNLNNMARLKKSNTAELIRCFAYITPDNSCCMRVNTMLNYCLVNRKITSFLNGGELPLISKSATIKSTQMSDCAVAENTTIAERTSIKSSIFGTWCNVHPKTRISDSILMNNVIVEEGVIIEHSIICDKAIIKTGSVLKHCLVGHNYTVPENTTKERVHLTEEGFMEI